MLGVTPEMIEQRIGIQPKECSGNDKHLIYHQQDDSLDGETALKMLDLPWAYAPNGSKNFSEATDHRFKDSKEALSQLARKQPGNWLPPEWKPASKPKIIWDA